MSRHAGISKTFMKLHVETTEKIICDGCGGVLDSEDEGAFPNVLEIFLNYEECVSSHHIRDYCADCLETRWGAICAVIDADPEDCS